MAGVVPELSFAARSMRMDLESDQVLTPSMVDAAVESVLEVYDEPTRERYRAAWAADETTEVARMLQSAMISRTSRLKSYKDVSRRPITVTQVLDTDEQISITRRYPDMDLRFLPTNKHDHALAAADRLLSSIRLHSKLPLNTKYPDFGGNLLMHVEQGNTNVVVVGGVHDIKDGSRNTMVNLRLRKLAGDPNVAENTRIMARSVLNNEGLYYVDGSMQTFNRECIIGVMSHVYDIPLLDITEMMNRTGMLAFEGVMHFSSRFFFETDGTLDDVAARFRIQDGKFEMGFLDSPSHWYGHDWKEFSIYGADQVLHCGNGVYSYKIYENRGDTISFRILRMPDTARAVGPQFAVRPGVPMMVVNSYEHSNIASMMSGRLTSTERFYPVDIWEKMVRAAMLDCSRNELDFPNHFKNYRGVIAGHKYNGVSTVSEVIPTTDVPWLVVDSALYALTQVTMLRRTTRLFATTEMEKRALASEHLPSLMVRTFCVSLTRFGSKLISPINNFVKLLIECGDRCADKLVGASLQARIRRIDGKTLVFAADTKTLIEYTEYPFLVHHRELALDEFVEGVLAGRAADKKGEPDANDSKVFVDGVQVSGRDAGSSEASETLVDGGAFEAVGRPAWVPFVGGKDPVITEEYYENKEFHTVGQRREAVLETVKAVEAEHKEVAAWAADVYGRFAGGRSPDADEVRKVSEANKGMDFWHVVDGVITETSLLGASIANFDYAGVYCPVWQDVIEPDGKVVATRLVPVEDSTFEDEMRGIFRSYKTLAVSYTGLVLVSDGMKILNGPHISAGLKFASNQSFEFEAAVMEGGPGCGKSYTITRNFKPGDMVITPLRKSAEDVRAKLVSLGHLTKKTAMRAVRTLDSVLVAAGKSGGMGSYNPPKAYMVHVDECFNTNAGRVYAVLALLRAQRVMMYGDKLQIEHVVRASVKLFYSQVSVRHVVKRWTVFRSAPEILAVYNRHYGDKLRTANKAKGLVSIVRDFPNLNPDEDTALLVMNQASKVLVKRRYPGTKVSIVTTHEAQGSEADHVYLFNFETRKISDDNPVYLYNRDRYVNVAVSRAKFKFTYVYTSEHSDLVKKWVNGARSPAYIKECGDLSTAGSSALGRT